MPFRSRPQRVLGKCVKAPTSKRHTCHGRGKLFPLRNLLICVTVFHALIIWTPTSWNFDTFSHSQPEAVGTSPQFIYLFAFNTFRWPCLELVSAIRWFDLNSFAVKKVFRNALWGWRNVARLEKGKERKRNAKEATRHISLLLFGSLLLRLIHIHSKFYCESSINTPAMWRWWCLQSKMTWLQQQQRQQRKKPEFHFMRTW